VTCSDYFFDIKVGFGSVDGIIEGLDVRDVEVRVVSGKFVFSFTGQGLRQLAGFWPKEADISWLGNSGIDRAREKVGSGTARADFSGNPDAADIAVDPVVLAKTRRNIESRIGLRRDGRGHDTEFGTGRRWVSANYETAPRVIHVVFTIGTGRIEVEHDR